MATEFTPKPLEEHESNMLRFLLNKQKQATQDLSEFAAHVLQSRGLSTEEWGISMGDLRTIRKNAPKPAPAPATNPPAQS